MKATAWVWTGLAMLLLCIPAIGGDKAPVPAKLLQAKTALIVNDGTPIKTFDALYSELKKWNRLRIVDSKDDADVVIMLASHPGGEGAAVVSGNMAIGGMFSVFYMYITDAKDGSPLWSDQNGAGAFTYSFPSKQLVKRLRERVGKQ